MLNISLFSQLRKISKMRRDSNEIDGLI